MSLSWSADTRYKRTEIERFPSNKTSKTADGLYWKHLQFPVSIQEFGPISKIDICRTEPHYIAVTGSSRVQIFNPLTNEVHKTLTKFKSAAHCGKFRRDGRLICVGGDDGAVKIFDLATKTLLRILQKQKESGSGGSSRLKKAESSEFSVKSCDFLLDSKCVAGFSDDKSVAIWDVATEDVVARWDVHKDYVRAGCASEINADVVASGSYDHTVRLFDKRQAGNGDSTACFDHGSPVEAVMFFPNGTLLASAGGHEVRIWDLIAGRMLAKMMPHNKTVTSLGMAMNNSRIVTASLDRQVKLHDVSTFQTVHSINFPSPVLSAAVAMDDSMVCAGMADGMVQFLHRKVPPSESEREAEEMNRKKTTSMRHRYLQYTAFDPQPDDVIVKQEKSIKESRHDFFLRKFEYSKALDQVLKLYVQKKYPEYTYSVLRELKRRKGLKTAIGGRDEKALGLLLQYLAKYINDSRFTQLLTEVMEVVLEMYGSQIGSCPATDKLFLEIRNRVDREVRNMRQLATLQGTVDLVLAASGASEKPELRSEEIAFREMHQGSSGSSGDGIKDSPSDSVLSWEKTLVHNIA